MNEIDFNNPPGLDPATWGLTYEKEKRLLGDDQRTAANSIMPGLLSQKGFEQTVWAGTVTDMFENIPNSSLSQKIHISHCGKSQDVDRIFSVYLIFINYKGLV